MYSGVPLITLPGGTTMSRLGAGVAVAAGLARFSLAASSKEYEDQAFEAINGCESARSRRAYVSSKGKVRQMCAPGQELGLWRDRLRLQSSGNEEQQEQGQEVTSASAAPLPPLFDTPGFATAMEATLEAAWARYEQGLPPSE